MFENFGERPRNSRIWLPEDCLRHLEPLKPQPSVLLRIAYAIVISCKPLMKSGIASLLAKIHAQR